MENAEARDPAEDGSSDWEYELHPTETDTFYVTIDLSHGPKNAHQVKKSAAADEGDDIRVGGQEIHGPVLEAADSTNEPEMRNVEPSVQIVDLHTEHPLLLYKSNLYSCNWMETIGTDLHFCQVPNSINLDTSSAKNNYLADLSINPLRQGDEWALLATSSIRLIGHPIKPVQKDKVGRSQKLPDRNSAVAQSDSSEPVGFEGNQQNVVNSGDAQLLEIADSENRTHKISTDQKRQSSARFFERLEAAKKSRAQNESSKQNSIRVMETGNSDAISPRRDENHANSKRAQKSVGEDIPREEMLSELVDINEQTVLVARDQQNNGQEGTFIQTIDINRSNSSVQTPATFPSVSVESVETVTPAGFHDILPVVDAPEKVSDGATASIGEASSQQPTGQDAVLSGDRGRRLGRPRTRAPPSGRGQGRPRGSKARARGWALSDVVGLGEAISRVPTIRGSRTRIARRGRGGRRVEQIENITEDQNPESEARLEEDQSFPSKRRAIEKVIGEIADRSTD